MITCYVLSLGATVVSKTDGVHLSKLKIRWRRRTSIGNHNNVLEVIGIYSKGIDLAQKFGKVKK